jgi:hypothetical protein
MRSASNEVERPEYERCDNCSTFRRPRYHSAGGVCVGPCIDPEVLDDMYPDGWNAVV